MAFGFLAIFGQFPVSLCSEPGNMKLNAWYLKRGLVYYLINGLSYLTPVLLDRGADPVHGELLLHVRKGRFMLGTRDTLYSWDDRYMNFVWALEKVDFSLWPMPHILLIGTGLGSVPYILEKKFGLSFAMDAVEVHPVAVQFAEKYSLPRLRQKIRLTEADGSAFVKQAGGTYDLIIVDVCVEDRVPEAFVRPEFLEAAERLLSPGGVMLFNRFYSTYKDQFLTDRFYQQVFSRVFSRPELLDFSGTAVLMGRKTDDKSGGKSDWLKKRLK
jgi:hypothetical protein